MPLLLHFRGLRALPRRNMCQETAKVPEASQTPKPNPVFRLPATTVIEDRYLSTIEEIASHNRYNTYPGAGIRKDVKPPKRLVQAAVTLFKKYPVRNVLAEAKRLQQYLWSRRSPPENSAVTKTVRGIEQQLLYAELEKAEDDMLTPGELEKLQQKAIEKTKRTTYHWRPLELDAYLSVVYMSSHLVSNYATLYTILSELAATDPDYRPTSMLDFGSGLATSVWAVNEIWDTMREHYCWDRSADISTLARLLLQDGKDYADMIYPGVYFRQQFDRRDAQQSAGFDLVVSSHSLFELPNQRTRLQHIDKLWSQANNYLILAENGTVHGHRLIEEARMHVLQKYSSEEEKGHVVAPCAHDMPCEMVSDWIMRPCNFEVSHRVGTVNGQSGLFQRDPLKKSKRGTLTRYCYVVLKKGPPLEAHRYPRLLTEPQKRKSCIQCLMCMPDSRIRQINVHSNIVPNNVFKLAKNSMWGTRMPLICWEDLKLASKKVDNADDTSGGSDESGDTFDLATEDNHQCDTECHVREGSDKHNCDTEGPKS